MSLNTDYRIFNQGLRNLSDGISAITIADAAINELSGIAQRIEELAVQSMSGTFSSNQRASLQREVTALQSEWNRIVESTSFNGVNVLEGQGTSMVLQGGKGVDGTLSIRIGSETAGGNTRINTTSSGGEATGGDSSARAMTADGRFIAFDSLATNLATGDLNGVRDAFIKDRMLGTTTRVSTSSSGIEGNGDSIVKAVAENGSLVFFQSVATNLVSSDTNLAEDIFVKNTSTGITTRVSTNTSGVEANGASSLSAVSADGRYVAFASLAQNLVTSDTNSLQDVFLKDLQTGGVTRVSTDSAGNQALGGSSFMPALSGMSADGRFIAFTSGATNLVQNDGNSFNDAFVKDMVTGITRLVSTDSFGNQGNGNSTVQAISADGRFVAFESTATNLVSGDLNNAQDVFVKDLLTGTTTRASTSSTGIEGNSTSFVRALSADGRYVTMGSLASNLVDNDTNLAAEV